MKKTCKTLRHFIALGILLLMSGCVDFETYSQSLDLKKKTGVIICTGINSDSGNQTGIENNFKDLIEIFYGKSGEEKESQVKFLSKQLSTADNKLNAKIEFAITGDITEKALKEIGMSMSDDGSGNVVLTDVPADTYISSNAEVIQRGPTIDLKWPKNANRIEYKIKGSMKKDQKYTNLLPYWLEWKKKNGKG